MTAVICPVCSNKVHKEQFVGSVAHCSCGAAIAMDSNLVSKRDKASMSLIFMTILIIASVMHVVNWDTYALQIVPLKLKQLIGAASAHDLASIGEICDQRQKSNCVVDSYTNAYTIDTKHIQGLVRVGELQVQAKEYRQGVITYTNYFKSGGKDLEARYNYARALAEIGDFKSSKKQFSFLLSAKGGPSKFTIARSYVEYLIRFKEYTLAKEIIEKHRKSDEGAGLFLEKELTLVNQKLATGKAFADRSKHL